MFCIKCGSKLIDGARFCHICGQKAVLQEQPPVPEVIIPKSHAYTLVCPPEKYRLNPYKYSMSLAAELMTLSRLNRRKLDMEDFMDVWFAPEPATTHNYFETLLGCFYREYSIYADIPYSVMFPERSAEFVNPGVNVDYLLCRNGKPVLAIQLPDPSDYMFKAPSYTWKAFEAYKLPALRFFLGWTNELNYSVDRINACLSGRI